MDAREVERAHLEAGRKFLAMTPSKKALQSQARRERESYDEDQAYMRQLGMANPELRRAKTAPSGPVRLPPNRPGLAEMRDFTDERVLSDEIRRDNVRSEDVWNDPDFVPYDRIPKGMTFAEQYAARMKDLELTGVPDSEQEVVSSPEKKIGFFKRLFTGGGAAYAVGNSALAAVIVASSVLGSLR